MTYTTPSLRAAALLVAAAGAACSTQGTGNKVDFSYQSCLLGCPLSDHSIAAGGAHEGISATPRSGVPAIRAVSSSNSQVVTFSLNAQNNSINSASAVP